LLPVFTIGINTSVHCLIPCFLLRACRVTQLHLSGIKARCRCTDDSCSHCAGVFIVLHFSKFPLNLPSYTHLKTPSLYSARYPYACHITSKVVNFPPPQWWYAADPFWTLRERQMWKKKRKKALSRRDRSPCHRPTPPSLCDKSVRNDLCLLIWCNVPSSFSSSAGASALPAAAPPAPPEAAAGAAPPPEPTFRSRSLTSLPSRACQISESESRGGSIEACAPWRRELSRWARLPRSLRP
jgi:hypothetical protein